MSTQPIPDFTSEPTANEWHQFLTPGAPDEWEGDEDLLDEGGEL